MMKRKRKREEEWKEKRERIKGRGRKNQNPSLKPISKTENTNSIFKTHITFFF